MDDVVELLEPLELDEPDEDDDDEPDVPDDDELAPLDEDGLDSHAARPNTNATTLAQA